jgi:hypothetical protein
MLDLARPLTSKLTARQRKVGRYAAPAQLILKYLTEGTKKDLIFLEAAADNSGGGGDSEERRLQQRDRSVGETEAEVPE